jgi:hypothetical protein
MTSQAISARPHYKGTTCDATANPYGCNATVTPSAKDLDCGTISWYPPAYQAFTKRDMVGRRKLKPDKIR